MRRTIVMSDPQGRPEVLERILECSGYERGTDRLVVAGDIVGTEPGGLRCVREVEDAGAEVLVGNHELAFARGETIDERDDEVDPELFRLVEERIRSGDWQLATLVEPDIVVTHGGLSSAFEPLFAQVRCDIPTLVETLNQRWRSSLEEGHGGAKWDWTELLTGPMGPLWWRPTDPQGPLRGLAQIVGHTPREVLRDAALARRLESQGFYLVDPFTRGWLLRGSPDPAPCRFAVVEHGRVRVEEA